MFGENAGCFSRSDSKSTSDWNARRVRPYPGPPVTWPETMNRKMTVFLWKVLRFDLKWMELYDVFWVDKNMRDLVRLVK